MEAESENKAKLMRTKKTAKFYCGCCTSVCRKCTGYVKVVWTE